MAAPPDTASRIELLERPEVRRFLERSRVGHLATADAGGVPSVMPFCYQVDPPHLYTVIDAKPKAGDWRRLRRVRNVRANPRVAVVVDRWEEDWGRLGWVLLRGAAEVIPDGEAQRRGLALLRAKYPQYRDMPLEERPVIRIAIDHVRAWGDLGRPAGEARP